MRQAALVFVIGIAVCAALSLDALATPSEQPLLKPDPEGILCRYKNSSKVDACESGGPCAVKNITSADELCEEIYLHDYAVELPFMANNFTTPYIAAPGCPGHAVDHRHVPLVALRTGSRYRSTVCTLTCGKLCERVSDSELYRQGHMLRTMVPLCHCKYLITQELPKARSNATAPATD